MHALHLLYVFVFDALSELACFFQFRKSCGGTTPCVLQSEALHENVAAQILAKVALGVGLSTCKLGTHVKFEVSVGCQLLYKLEAKVLWASSSQIFEASSTWS